MQINYSLRRYDFIYGFLSILCMSIFLFTDDINITISSTAFLMFIIISIIWGYYNNYILIIISLLLENQLGNLIPQNIQLYTIYLQTQDFAYMVLLVLGVFFYVKLFYKKNNKYNIKYSFLMWIPLIFISAINTNINYGQNFVLGLFTQRSILLYSCYFPISLAISCDFIDTNKVRDIIISISKIYTIIYILQYCIYLYSGVLFLSIPIQDRVGVRLIYSGCYLLAIAIMLMMDEFVKKKIILSDWIWILLMMFIILLISQLRVLSVSLLLAIGLSLLINSKTRVKSIIKLFPLLLIIMFLFRAPIFDFLNYTINDLNMDSPGSSFGTRVLEKEFYDRNLQGNEILGMGVLNDNNAVNSDITGSSMNYYLNDLGIYELLYNYGYAGILIYFIFILRLMYIGYNEMKGNNSSLIFMFGLFSIISSFTVLIFTVRPVLFLMMLTIGTQTKKA